ncbi:ATP-dependent DNA helicase [Bacillus thuringiensis]|uniref:DNA 3'-5' helicase n=3 Tax=Bacillus thuringiensis TaxID=1428 RepID=A0A9W3TA14_BACTU|nr:ATP-dependent helicase [Bacillus thuringiensis]AQY37372.1 ATP-dependent DNA helicase [Bacillus thuringiensis]MDR4150591.1 ATP-dependent helicase [Bacillus thuringiensis]MED2518705.1 ATP-dependent helicase [Bacillus thuringiensis]
MKNRLLYNNVKDDKVMDNIIQMLNDEQRNAATSTSQYLKVSAGPGTGKTSTLAARILHLQTTEELSSDNILAISFSRSAKKQLINRLYEYTAINGSGSLIEILTFHSLAHRIIRHGIFYKESNLRTGFHILPTTKIILEKPDLIKDLCKEYTNREIVASSLPRALNMIRQGFEGVVYKHWQEIDLYTEFRVPLDSGQRVIITGKDMIEFWKRIQRVNLIKNQTDYQGLITESLEILTKESYTYEQITTNLRHILVDEFQDTSLAQETLLFQLAGVDKHIMVVGDKNQAIYTFNGSNHGNIQHFYEHFYNKHPLKTEEVYLNKNYRSTQEIIALSNHFIQENIIEPNNKTDSGITPYIINTPTIELAAEYIAQQVHHLKEHKNASYEDICILYRKNSTYSPQANQVKTALHSIGIPYKDDLIDKEEKLNLKESLLHICDEYPSASLQELVHLLAEEPMKEFVLNAMEDGALDTDDLIDFIIELDDFVPEDIHDSVTIRSVHSSKGQEYPIVFILFLGDKQFPHGSNPNIAEERRLLYVGITRAQKRLFLLGQHGIHFDDFLSNCKTAPNTKYEVLYSLTEESQSIKMSNTDIQLIKETEQQQLLEDLKKQQLLEDAMTDW